MIGRSLNIVLLINIFLISGNALYSQYVSKDNYTGSWLTPGSWNPVWTVPQTDISGLNVTIQGYITLIGSLSFSGSSTELRVNDTLVIQGNLTLGNNNHLTVTDNGILIIRGNLTIDNQTSVKADGYLITTGNIIKKSSVNQGSFTSNDNPVKVFIGGTISKTGITYNNPSYPVVNMISPQTIIWPSSGYGFGNMTDIINDPIYGFFQTTCVTPSATSNSPVCAGKTINLFSSGGISYTWSGPDGFTSSEQNPSISKSDEDMGGSYVVTISDYGCSPAVIPVSIVIKPIPVVTITSNDNICINEQMALTAAPAGGTFEVKGGPGIISGNILTAVGLGTINIGYTYTDVCITNVVQTIIVNDMPVAMAGMDQDLQFVFETEMNAELQSDETGEWSVVEGGAKIQDLHSPVSPVTGLSVGKNIFLWNVRKGSCEARDEIIITVADLIVPSVITPDGDGKNDFFKINAPAGGINLIIFNRWGIEEFSDANYLNNWEGRNNNGAKLPEDTYFYILKFGNVSVKKGSVLIKR